MTAAGILLDGSTHTYFVDGEMKPGVTRVLEDVGIIDYSQIPDGVRVRALERGRHVHQVCQYHDEGDLGTVPAGLQCYLDAWRRFRDDYVFVPRLIEHRGYHALYGYAGTLDREGVIKDGSDVLLDIKTSVAPWWAAIQTAAYAAFMEQPAKRRRMAVALLADGNYKVHSYRCADYARDMNDFHAALNTYRCKRRNR